MRPTQNQFIDAPGGGRIIKSSQISFSILHCQTRAQRKRVAAEKEERRNERALTFKKSQSERYAVRSDVVPVGGLRLASLACTHSTDQSRIAFARALGVSWVEPGFS